MLTYRHWPTDHCLSLSHHVVGSHWDSVVCWALVSDLPRVGTPSACTQMLLLHNLPINNYWVTSGFSTQPRGYFRRWDLINKKDKMNVYVTHFCRDTTFIFNWVSLTLACKKKMARVLSFVHVTSTTSSVCWTSLFYAWLTVPAAMYMWCFLWYSVTWGSLTFWWQSDACNCSMFCTCTWSGSPHNVLQSSRFKQAPQLSPHMHQTKCSC